MIFSIEDMRNMDIVVQGYRMSLWQILWPLANFYGLWQIFMASGKFLWPLANFYGLWQIFMARSASRQNRMGLELDIFGFWPH